MYLDGARPQRCSSPTFPALAHTIGVLSNNEYDLAEKHRTVICIVKIVDIGLENARRKRNKIIKGRNKVPHRRSPIARSLPFLSFARHVSILCAS